MNKLDELGGLDYAKDKSEECRRKAGNHIGLIYAALIERVEELERELANANARVRNKDVEISDLNYHLDTMKGKVPKRPWRWVKKFQMGHRRNHRCLESVPEPDNGVGDGHDRTVGIILSDYWSEHPTELMLFVQAEINLSSERESKLQRYRELAEMFEGLSVYPNENGQPMPTVLAWRTISTKARELLKEDF